MVEILDKTTLFSACRSRLERFGVRVNKFGANFVVFDRDDGLVLLTETERFESDTEQLLQYSRMVLEHCQHGENNDEQDSGVCAFGDFGEILAISLRQMDELVGVALIDLGDVGTARKYLSEMLEIFAEGFCFESKAHDEIESVGTELAQAYEELVLLHRISVNMKVTGCLSDYLQMACDNLTGIVNVEGIVILLKKNTEDRRGLVVAAGSGLIDMDDRQATILESRLVDEISDGREALLDSEVDGSFKYDWPSNIRSIAAVPLFGKDKIGIHFADRNENFSSIVGLMVAFNRLDKPDFDSTDIKLFNSVANTCAVFIGNGELFNDMKELFIGSLKALTNTIDAKDQYTRGHSERVAYISRWIAERLVEEEMLDPAQVHKVYLAGLLHDIGKMGITEMVLRKKGKLSEQEYNHIKMHPSIGAGILSEIKQMIDIVPGVLYHHERIDGKGYPDGLVDDQIPIISKIIGLADSFDAMTSKRTYREAFDVDEAMAEIEINLGKQFDEEIGRIFIRSDIHKLWDILQSGFVGDSDMSKFSQFETIAVESLIK